jgi:hypothetical protein
MAGLDYSGVVEPDYHLGKWKQSGMVTEQVKRISEEVLHIWQHKESLGRKRFEGQFSVKRNRRVYYDTVGIMESQVQEFRLCPNCPGVDTIQSHNDRGATLLGITIPRKACPACQKEGYDLFEQAKGARTRKIFLQDLVRDEFFTG